MLRCLCVIALIVTTDTYRILIVYPAPLVSHQQQAHAIIRGLLTFGHEVVFVTTMTPPYTHPNLQIINVDQSVLRSKDLIQETIMEKLAPLAFIKQYEYAERLILADMLQMDSVKYFMQNETFDAVIVENRVTVASLAFAVHFNCTSIGLVTLQSQSSNYREMGNPSHPILHPGDLVMAPMNPNFWTRLNMFYNFLQHQKFVYFDLWKSNERYLKKCFPHLNVDSVGLIRNIDLQIEAVSPILNFRPLLPNVVQIGFIHIEPPKPLENDLKHFLDSAKDGAIYVSFGNTVQSVTMGTRLLNVLIEVLGTLPYKVIWKFEKEISVQNNIKIMSSSPQADLLAHENMKLFLTQGGLQSIEESVSCGVPFVVIPFFADQNHNAERLQQLGWGKYIFREDVTVSSLKELILEVISNGVYKENVEHSQRLIRDTPMKPIETAIWWIEYAIRNRGARELKYNRLPIYQYLFIDVIFVLTVALLVLLLGIKFLLRSERLGFYKIKFYDLPQDD